MARVITSARTSKLKPVMADAAQDHQGVFERIERAPFQMALLLQDQPVETHRLIPRFQETRGASSSREFGSRHLLYVANQI